MNFIRKAVTTLGGIFLAVLLIAALAPRATHGLVAALVQVANTTTNPAVTSDADRSTRLPYQSFVSFTPSSSGVSPQSVSTATVPAGYRLVIQNVSANISIQTANPVPSACISSNFSPSLAFPCFTGTFIGSVVDEGIFNQQVTRYIGPGDTPIVTFLGDFYSTCAGCSSVTVTGYLENCSVTGCPAIE